MGYQMTKAMFKSLVKSRKGEELKMNPYKLLKSLTKNLSFITNRNPTEINRWDKIFIQLLRKG